MIIASVTNIVLDLIFVCVFHWGVAGAAIATVIGQAVSALICGATLLRISLLKLEKHEHWHSWKLCGRLCRMGLPLSMSDLIIGVGGIVLQNQVNSYSVSFVAGYSATNRLYGLLETSGIALGSAFSTFIGQNYGAEKYGRIRTCTKARHRGGVVHRRGHSDLHEPAARAAAVAFRGHQHRRWQRGAGLWHAIPADHALFLPALYLLHIFRSGVQALGNTTVPLLSGIMEFCMRVGTVLIFPLCWGIRSFSMPKWSHGSALRRCCACAISRGCGSSPGRMYNPSRLRRLCAGGQPMPPKNTVSIFRITQPNPAIGGVLHIMNRVMHSLPRTFPRFPLSNG